MKTAVMIGLKWTLEKAYPPRLREALGRRVHLHPSEIDGSAWKEHRAALAQADFVLSTWGMAPLDADLLAAMPKLEAVLYAAGTVKAFITPEAVERGVVICGAAGANAVPVSEYALAVILLGLKGFWVFQRGMGAGPDGCAQVQAPGIYGSTVGLVSLGEIGRRVVRLLSGHDVNILVHDPYVRAGGTSAGRVRHVSLDELFARSDVVSLHTPWLPETEKMIGADLLRSMKRGATLVNTARGAIIDEDALCAVLRERPDLTAVLDVTWPEPPVPDSPLRSLPNVVLTPHIAGSMGPEVARMGRWMASDLLRLLRGVPLRHRIDSGALARMA